MKCCQVFFTKKSFTQKINRKRTKILMKAVCHISCPRLLSHVSCPKSPVSCLLSHSPVSCLTSPVSRLLSHAPCLKSPVSRLLSHVSCLKSSVLCCVSLFYLLLVDWWYSTVLRAGVCEAGGHGCQVLDGVYFSKVF